jgi:hypothetical protein
MSTIRLQRWSTNAAYWNKVSQSSSHNKLLLLSLVYKERTYHDVRMSMRLETPDGFS